jgi:hypothetical protein
MHHNQLGIEASQDIVAQAPFGHFPRTKILQYYVAFQSEAARQLLPSGQMKITGNALFVAGLDEPRIRSVTLSNSPGAILISPFRWLHFDHFRPEIRKESGHERTREKAAELEHSNACELAGIRLPGVQ